MVLKKAKFGKNTGNTQRRKFACKKLDQKTIVSVDSHLLEQLKKSDRTEIVKILSATETSFSSNKKRRWNFGELISTLQQKNKKYLLPFEPYKKVIKRKHQKRQVEPDIPDSSNPSKDIVLTDKKHMTFKYNKRNTELSQKNGNRRATGRYRSIRKGYSVFCDEVLQECYEMEFDDSINMEDVYGTAPNDVDCKNAPTTAILEDFIVSNKTKQPKKSQRESQINTKSAAIKAFCFIDRPTVESTVTINTCNEELGNVVVQLPLTMAVNSYTITPSLLEENYGRRYIEGGSYPRKFAIFKSMAVYSPMILATVLRDEERISKIKIKVLGTDLDYISLKETKLDDFKHVVSTIFLKALIKKGKECTKGYTPYVPYLIPTSSGTVTTDSLFSKFLKSEKALSTVHGKNNINGAHFCTKDETCAVCMNQGELVTTSKTCGHAFCNTCIKTFITIKVRETAEFPCMDQRCTQVMDIVTILTFCDNKYYKQFCYRKIQSLILNSKSSLKHCPTPSCKSIGVKVETTAIETCPDKVLSLKAHQVGCKQCGNYWCFKCSEKHWPLSCAAFRKYQGFKHEMVDFQNETRMNIKKLKNLKRCPRCRVVIEKNGGCNFMYCRQCSCSFCWRCLKNHANFSESLYCVEIKETDEYQHLFLADHKGSLAMAAFYAVKAEDIQNRLKNINSNTGMLVKLLKVVYECYELLESFQVARVCTKSRHARKRYIGFINKLNSFVHTGENLLKEPTTRYTIAKHKELTIGLKTFIDRLIS